MIIGKLGTTAKHREECGWCYGNGCFSCNNRGWVETAEGREAREEWEDGAYDRWQDDRITGGDQ